MIGGSSIAEELASLSKWRNVALPITPQEHLERLERARLLMSDAGVDALIIGAGDSLRYFTGISWGMIERLVAMVLTTNGPPGLVCPRFEAGSLDAILEIEMDIRYWEEDANPAELIGQLLKERGCNAVAVDPQLPFTMAEKLRRTAPSASLHDASAIVNGCRSVKSKSELAILAQAKQMTLEVHRRAARVLEVGICASDVSKFIDDAHRRIGATGSSFCIVQFGASTSFPHGLPEDDVLCEGDMVLIDTGCVIHGYNSDITRSFVFGKPSDEQRLVWQTERDAQQSAFETARPGVLCEQIDAAARRVLESRGFGPDYQVPGLPHRTGHGIGLTIHEAPYLVRGDRTALLPGMCFSNEPMIVVPGRFGVRLEDHFHVTETGAEWFTTPSAGIDRPFD